jgi:uroporphyrin-III C-methyltransferase / precorrin-2 dehydrogenase / sirohydrochlorin ferrochelatase
LRKLELLIAAGCAVTVISPSIHDGVRSAIDAKSVRWINREFRSGDCIGYQLVIAATGRREINRMVFEESNSLCIPVNVVDDPELCTVIFPAIWRQGPLEISVSTEGAAPFMAAAVRDRLAGYGAALTRWVETASKFRAVVRSEVTDWDKKHQLYRQFAEAIHAGDPPDAPESNKLSDWIAWLKKLGVRNER